MNDQVAFVTEIRVGTLSIAVNVLKINFFNAAPRNMFWYIVGDDVQINLNTILTRVPRRWINYKCDPNESSPTTQNNSPKYRWGSLQKYYVNT